jgi:hypothetical protein
MDLAQGEPALNEPVRAIPGPRRRVEDPFVVFEADWLNRHAWLEGTSFELD